jgi:membrane protein
MKRIWLWLVAVWGAYLLGRRQCAHTAAPPLGQRQSEHTAAPPPPDSRPRGLRTLALLAAILEVWARIVPRRRHRKPRPASRRVAGRLGGEAVVARTADSWQPMPSQPGAAAVMPAASPPANAESQQAVPAEGIPSSALARWWCYARELFRRFSEDQVPVFAASLSFFGILSLVPVLLVALAALGFLVQDPHQAVVHLQHLVEQLLPGAKAKAAAAQLIQQAKIEDQLATLMRTRGITGVIGLASLVWAALQIVVSAATAMNAAWSVEETRGWLKLRLTALGVLIGAGALFLLSLLPSSGPDFIRNLHIPWLGLPEHVPWYIDLGFTLVAVGLNIGMFTVIYRFLPNAPVTWREAAVGGVVAGVLWELAKQGFSLYVARFGNYDKMYGSLGGIVILIVWIYYTSLVLLLGAEVAKLYKDVKEGRLRRESPVPAASTP